MFGGDSSGGFNPLGMFGALGGSSGLPDPLSASTPSYASGVGAKPAGAKPGGFGSTLLTSGQGVDDSNTNYAKKSLLGQ